MLLLLKAHMTLQMLHLRYRDRWSMVLNERIPDIAWIDATFKAFNRERVQMRYQNEFQKFSLMKQNDELPTSKTAFKKHHIYILASQLLKYETIYPPDTVPVSTWKGEDVFLRKNVYEMHNAVRWLQNGKQVKKGEVPYKELPKKIIHKKRKLEEIEDVNLPRAMSGYYGPWQVEDYVPPTAMNGKVPRSEHGNVELFTPDMLPRGCVHLTNYDRLTQVAKKIGIDCAPALIGWEHGRYPKPKMDGFVVCSENAEVLIEAWRQDNIERNRKKESDRVAKVMQNWVKLVKKLIKVHKLDKKSSKRLKKKGKGKQEKGKKENKERHVHKYKELIDLATGVCIKQCDCGFKLTYEKIDVQNK